MNKTNIYLSITFLPGVKLDSVVIRRAPGSASPLLVCCDQEKSILPGHTVVQLLALVLGSELCCCHHQPGEASLKAALHSCCDFSLVQHQRIAPHRNQNLQQNRALGQSLCSPRASCWSLGQSPVHSPFELEYQTRILSVKSG